MDASLELAAARVQGGCALAIGVFDGVHRGHAHLLHQVRETAQRLGVRSAAISFRNHPRTVLRVGGQTTYLTAVEERLRLLQACGVDYVAPLTFTKELSQRTAEQFMELLVQQLGMRALVAGPDFALGKGRGGTLPVLRGLGERMGYDVVTATPYERQGQVVSSTGIKALLAAGDVVKAADLLGRPFRITGPVVQGEHRGRALGFPTANIAVAPNVHLPGDGVYCTVAWVNERRMDSVSSIGVRPTFGGNLARTVETYVLDFNGDLYGKLVSIDLVQRLRPELRFAAVGELIEQMGRDVDAARHVLAGEARP